MNNIFRLLAIVGAAVLLNACSNVYLGKLTKPISPEELLDYTSEQVSFSTQNNNIKEDLSDWISVDKPSRADLACDKHDKKCAHVIEVLNKYSIPFAFADEGNVASDITLYYDSVEARDCEQFERNNSAFGCANSINVLNMVGDYKKVVPSNSLAPAAASLERN